MRRRHGLQLPLDPHQVGAVLVFCGLAAGCYAFQLVLVEDRTTYIALCVVYTVVVAATLALDIVCSMIDPSDPGLRCGSTDGEFYCSLCEVSVGKSSKHCRACDRCVEGFDHHCKWLNNCVGARNYGQFFSLVSLAGTLLSLQFGWALWLFVISFTDKQGMQLRVALNYNGRVNYQGWQAMLAIYMAVLAACVCMLVELLAFHVVLISKDMTTYDFIIAQREQLAAGVPGAPIGGTSTASSLYRLFVHVIKCGPCCGSTRVQPHDSAVLPATAKKKVHVSLNPCAACHTQKPEGSPQTWIQQGKLTVTATRQGPKQEDTAVKLDMEQAQVGGACASSTSSRDAQAEISTPIKAHLPTTPPGPVPEGLSSLAWLPHTQCQRLYNGGQMIRSAPHLADTSTTAPVMIGALPLPAAYSLPRGPGHLPSTSTGSQYNTFPVAAYHDISMMARSASRQHGYAAAGGQVPAVRQEGYQPDYLTASLGRAGAAGRTQP